MQQNIIEVETVMRKFVMFAALSAFVFGASIAQAACTQEDAMKKATQVSTQIQALAQKDPQKFQKVMQEFTTKSQELQGATDMDAVCKYYDEMIEKTK